MISRPRRDCEAWAWAYRWGTLSRPAARRSRKAHLVARCFLDIDKTAAKCGRTSLN